MTFSIHYTVRERVTEVASERTRLTGRNKFVRLTNRTRKKRLAAFQFPPRLQPHKAAELVTNYVSNIRFTLLDAALSFTHRAHKRVNWREQQARRMREEEIRRLNDKNACIKQLIFSYPSSREKFEIHYPMIQIFLWNFCQWNFCLEGKNLEII